ncbi:hypothetical protein NQZ68_038625 [Dissostichus eleginoides]|nr:hypothetical protein NQZ68_038625 [Dissostichus eleginoides]
MALCSEPASVSSEVKGELKKERKVAVITGITGQETARLVFHIGLAWSALTLALGQENMTPAIALNTVGTDEGLPVPVPSPPPPDKAETAPVNPLLTALHLDGNPGRDGSYLAEFLLAKGYEVHGILRRSSSFNTGRIEHLYQNPQTHTEGNMKLHYGDLTDSTCLVKIINQVKPSEIYNLGAQSHVKVL